MKRPAWLLLLVLVVSCGTESFFSADEKLYSIEVTSITEGQTLAKDDWISFDVSAGEEEVAPSLLLINLYGADTEPIAELTVPKEEIEQEEHRLDFDNLELATGYYEIEFILYGGESVLTEKRIPFFYAADRYGIWGVEASLPVIYPAAKVLLKANLALPEDADPYIRWIQDKAVLASGTLAEGLDQIYWLAPEEEGVYSLTVELFPVPPPEEMEFRLNSSIYMDTELYVSSNVKSENDLMPRDSYYSLLHMNGTLADIGACAGDSEKGLADAQEIGLLEPVAREGNLGFLITNSAGFLIPRFILPLEDGYLAPFSLSMGITLESLDAGLRFLRAASGEQAFALTLFLNEDLAPAALLAAGLEELLIPSGMAPLSTDVRYLFTVSLRPQAEEGFYELIWYVDGREKNRLVFELPMDPLPAAGETRVGGSGGFNGFLDELAVYYRDGDDRPTADRSIFQTVMRQRWGGGLIYAAGFDGDEIPAAEATETAALVETQGPVRAEAGVLTLEPGSRLSVAFAERRRPVLVLELTEQKWVRMEGDGGALVATTVEAPEDNDQSGVLLLPKGLWEVKLAGVDSVHLAASDRASLSLDSLLIYSEQ